MNDSVFEIVEKSSQIQKLDFFSIEFAKLAEERELTEEQIQAVGMVFERLQQKKIETTIPRWGYHAFLAFIQPACADWIKYAMELLARFVCIRGREWPWILVLPPSSRR